MTLKTRHEEEETLLPLDRGCFAEGRRHSSPRPSQDETKTLRFSKHRCIPDSEDAFSHRDDNCARNGGDSR